MSASEGNQGSGSALREQLETALAENAALKRQVVVQASGLDISSPLNKMFLDNYEGDWDPEAFTAKAKEFGLIKDKEEGAADGQEPPVSSGGGEVAESGSEGDSNVSHARQFDSIFDSTGDGGGTPPSEAKDWMKAKSREEFLSKYDGRVI